MICVKMEDGIKSRRSNSMMTNQKEVKVDEEIKNKRSNSMMSSMDSLAKIRFGESIISIDLISRVEKNIQFLFKMRK